MVHKKMSILEEVCQVLVRPGFKLTKSLLLPYV